MLCLFSWQRASRYLWFPDTRDDNRSINAIERETEFKAMDYSRREMCLLLPAMPALMMTLKAQGSSTSVLLSKAYPFETLKAQADGPNKFRPIFEGTTHDGFHIALHQTDLAPGAMPHPPHHHVYEEIFLVREGTVVVTIAGRESTLGPGSVAYVASNDEHGIRNAGTTHAQYFVFELGSGGSS